MSQFKVGETYKTRQAGVLRTVVGFLEDGRILVCVPNKPHNLSLRRSDGTFESSSMADLILPPKVEKYVKLSDVQNRLPGSLLVGGILADIPTRDILETE